jgi:gluconolactonase
MFIALLATAFAGLAAGPVDTVADGFGFTEGPVWTDSEGLLFTDIPNDVILRPDKSIFRKPSGKANGLIIDEKGRLVACEHGNRQVSRTETDGTVTILAESFENKKLNSPNDAIALANGTVYFTDPPYGLEGREQELAFQGVYRIAPDGTLTCEVRDFVKPNGIGVSPDEKTLYVADTEGQHIRAFTIGDDGALRGGVVLCDIPYPDGMAIDETGNIWCTAADGVRAISPAGVLLETVDVPQPPANCAFGGADRKTLYITARSGLYSVKTTVAGMPPASAR